MTDSCACQEDAAGGRRLPAYLGVGFGVLNVSFAAILIRLAQADAHSLAIAAWRLTLASLILTPIVLATRRSEIVSLARRDCVLMAASGALLAVHFASWITSLAYTTVAASVALVSTTPIFVGLASRMLLREPLPRAMIAAITIATIGSAVIGLGDLGRGAHHLQGDLLAIVGAISGAGYFLIGRRLRGGISLPAYVYPVYGAAAVVLLAWLFASGLDPLPATPRAWVWIALMAVGPQLLGHSALNWALRYLSATYVTIATLAEPIGSTLLAWLLLAETPSALTLAGGAVVLIGVAVASRAERAEPSEGVGDLA
jgi:drug/metabolite transporter (DMT)-like permease